MKYFLVNALIIFFLLGFYSCRKDIETRPETTNVPLEKCTFNPTFTWSTSRIVDIAIVCDRTTVINITSADNQIRYHRGMHQGKNKSYQVKVSLPAVVTRIKINDKPVEIKGNSITFYLN
ncbi:MAG: hypothetical protein PHP04_05140 [Bacteroidales bacterium]|nr:hypothetical protein [Bacteroidales bacterium]